MTLWAAEASASVEAMLVQYGAMGVLAGLALLAVRTLFARQVSSHERDIARADRAEAELNALNKLIREQLVAELTRATDAISRVTSMVRDDQWKG